MTLAYSVVKLDGPRPHCASDLALVDAAYDRPGGPEAHELRTSVCPGCPIGEACLTWAMGRREDGVWGGTSPNVRTRHGGPDRKHVTPSTRPALEPYRPVIAADVPVAVIRAWALAHGLNVHPTKGRMSEAIREQYAAANHA